MERRDIITLAALAGLTWPLVAQAQQAAMPVIGFLHSGSPEPNAKRVAVFRKGLRDAGLVEGENVAIEFRWAHGEDDKLAELAADLVRRRVAVIATLSSTAAAVAAKAATSTIPIFFLIADPPDALGLVDSLNRPGGNATGITTLAVEVAAKRFGFLRELLPNAPAVAALLKPTHPSTPAVTARLQAAAATSGVSLIMLNAGTDHEIEEAFAALKPGIGLLIGTDPFFFARRAALVALAARNAVPSIYDNRDAVELGGLLSYGSNQLRLWEEAAASIARILKGEKPADLPVRQATVFETAVNLKTARTLGVTVPGTILALADDVIE